MVNLKVHLLVLEKNFGGLWKEAASRLNSKQAIRQIHGIAKIGLYILKQTETYFYNNKGYWHNRSLVWPVKISIISFN